MDPEDLQPIFLLKLSLFLDELILFAFFFNSSIVLQESLVLLCCLREKTVIDELLDLLVNQIRVDYFRNLLPRNCFDLVDQSLDVDGTVILYLSLILAQNVDLSQSHSAMVQSVYFFS